MNKVFRKIHLWLSVPVGLIITVICLTGAALVFERDVTESLDPELYKVTYTEGNAPLPPSELVAAIRRQVPDSLERLSLQLPGERDGVCMATFKGTGKRSLSVNPYTGEVNGWTKSYPFFQTMRKLHRWLMDPPAYKGAKSAGKVIVGVTTLVMVVILVSGVAIWVPRTRKALKNRLLVSCTKGWRRFWYDSHVSLGIYATLFLLVMALTGLTWSFQWYRTAAYGLFGVSTARPAMSAPQQRGKEKQAGVRLCGMGRRGIRTASPLFLVRLHLADGREGTGKQARQYAQQRYGGIRRSNGGDHVCNGLRRYSQSTENEGMVLCLPHRLLGRHDDQGALLSGGLHRRNPASERILFVVEEKKTAFEKKGAVTCLLTGRRPLSSKDSFRRSNSEAGSLFPSKAEWQKLGFVF